MVLFLVWRGSKSREMDMLCICLDFCTVFESTDTAAVVHKHVYMYSACTSSSLSTDMSSAPS